MLRLCKSLEVPSGSWSQSLSLQYSVYLDLSSIPLLSPPSSKLAAPEILSEAQAFPQSDIWSLGVLLYVLLSGQLPFRGESAEETKDNILGVRFKFEWLYKEVTMEATRLLMWIFKRGAW